MDSNQVHMVVYIPTRHPMSGSYDPVAQNYTDYLITKEQAAELRAMVNLPSAPGSANLANI